MVQRQLGHASLSTTEALYGHLEEAFLRDAAERVERRIWSAAHDVRRAAPGTMGEERVDATAADLLPRVVPRGR
ncbi:MAG: hypothetical protein QOF29_3696 [bacterium]